MVTGSKVGRGYNQLYVDREYFNLGQIKQLSQPSLSSKTLVSSGIVNSDDTLIIVDEETLIRLPEGQAGEIWLCNEKSVAKGYWGRPQLTKHRFAATLAQEPAQYRYYRTGDIGFIWKNELYVAGRADDLIILRGRNYFAEDIESVVQPQVPEARVCCFTCQAGRDTQLVLLLAVSSRPVKKMDFCALSTQLQLAVRQSFNFSFNDIVFTASKDFKVTTSGKVQRKNNQQAYLDKAFTTLFSWADLTRSALKTREHIQLSYFDYQQLSSADRWQYLNSVFLNRIGSTLDIPNEHINPTFTLGRLGVDSIQTIELAANFKTLFNGCVLSEELLFTSTIEELMLHTYHALELRISDQPDNPLRS